MSDELERVFPSKIMFYFPDRRKQVLVEGFLLIISGKFNLYFLWLSVGPLTVEVMYFLLKGIVILIISGKAPVPTCLNSVFILKMCITSHVQTEAYFFANKPNLLPLSLSWLVTSCWSVFDMQSQHLTVISSPYVVTVCLS